MNTTATTPQALNEPRQPSTGPPPAPQPNAVAAHNSHAGVWFFIFLLAVGGAVYFTKSWWSGLIPGATTAPAKDNSKDRAFPVVVAVARKGDMNIYLPGLGTVTPLKTVTVRSRVDGQILKIDFVEGQLVKKDQTVLVEIDPGPFQAAVKQAEGTLAKDQAQLANALDTLKRYQEAAGTVTEQTIATAQATVDQFKGQVEVDQGLLDNAKLQLSYCTIKAPIDGTVGLRMVDEGNIVHASDVNGLCVITQLQPITVIFTLPEDNIHQVLKKQQQSDPIVVDAFNRDLTRKLGTGKLTAVDNQVDPTTGSFKLKAEFANERFLLYPNQFVNARLLIDTLQGVTIVPNSAIQRAPNSTYVYVADKTANTVKSQTVTIGQVQGEETSITDGITAGDIVVTDGVDKLQSGAKVIFKVPDASSSDSSTQPTTARSHGDGGEGATRLRGSSTRPSGDAGGDSGSEGGDGTHTHQHKHQSDQSSPQ